MPSSSASGRHAPSEPNGRARDGRAPDAQDHHADKGMLLTLNRGIRVLEEVARLEGQATARTLSKNLAINVSTCYQLLRTLVANEYVTRLPGSSYGLGPRIAYLAEHFEAVAAPPAELLAVLRDLHSRLGESVYVCLRSGSHLRIASFLEGTGAVRVSPLHVGYAGHLHARASGKAFLAFLEPEDVEAYVDKDDLEPLTAHTITDWGELLANLESVRQRGYAVDLEEFNDGVACMSVPLLGPEATVLGALAVSLPAGSFGARRDEIAAATLAAGRRGSEVLGYRGGYPPPP